MFIFRWTIPLTFSFNVEKLAFYDPINFFFKKSIFFLLNILLHSICCIMEENDFKCHFMLTFLVLRQGWIHQTKFQHGWVGANGGPGNGADGSWIVQCTKWWGGRFTTGCVSLFRLNYPLISPLLCSARREMAFCRPLALKEQGRVEWRIQHRPALLPCHPNGRHYEA